MCQPCSSSAAPSSSSPCSVASPLATIDEADNFTTSRKEQQQRRSSIDPPSISSPSSAKNSLPGSILRSSKPPTRGNKTVRFSDLSYVLSYEQQSTPSSTLYYTPQDYTRFKLDALKKARAIRRAIASSQAKSIRKSKDDAALSRYTKSWKSLPRLLEENGIHPIELIGIEHLLIGKAMSTVQLTLRESVSTLLLEEQARQVAEYGSLCCAEEVADTVKPFSSISMSVALIRSRFMEGC